MSLNVLNIWGEVILIVSSVVVLILFSLIFIPLGKRKGLPSRKASLPSSIISDQASEMEVIEEEDEKIRAEDYIENSGGDIDLANGPITPVVAIVLIGLIVWWLAYMVLNWSQYIFDVRALWR